MTKQEFLNKVKATLKKIDLLEDDLKKIKDEYIECNAPLQVGKYYKSPSLELNYPNYIGYCGAIYARNNGDFDAGFLRVKKDGTLSKVSAWRLGFRDDLVEVTPTGEPITRD